MVEFRSTGLPNSLLYFCSLSFSVYNRIFAEDRAEVPWYYLHHQCCQLASLITLSESLPRTDEIGQWHCDTGSGVGRATLSSTKFTLDRKHGATRQNRSYCIYESGEREDVNKSSYSEIFLLKHVSCFPSSVNTNADLKHAAFQTSYAFYLYSLQLTLKLLQII